MIITRSRINTVGYILLILLFCLAGGWGINRYKQMTDCYKWRPPLETFLVSIEVSQQEQLIEQARKFADKYEFKFDIVYYGSSGKDFLVDLRRKDIEVTLNNPFKRGEFKIGFYNNDCIHPTSAAEVGSLVDEFKVFISEIPGAEISEER